MGQQWLQLRLERNLPMLMRKHGVAMWPVICRENAEDPAYFSLVSPSVFAARRRTMYVRVAEMLPTYRDMMKTVYSLIGRAFSSEVITPGKTMNLDDVWRLRQQVNHMGLGTWFQPGVRVQSNAKTGVITMNEEDPVAIQKGDVPLVDFGITAMRLNTDTRHMGYVLRDREKTVPAGIAAALKKANRLRDILMAELRTGRSGNQILAAALERMRSEKIDGTVYSHPIGDHGHAAGPLIGLWDRQEGVPGRGDVTVIPNSWFSIELQATTPVREWDGKPLFVGLEEDAAVDAQGRVGWVYKPQTEFHLVGRGK